MRRRVRETHVQPSQLARVKLPFDGRGRPPRSGYDVNTYARAVRRGIEAVNAVLLREGLAVAVVPLVPDGLRERFAGKLAKLPAWIVSLARAPGTPHYEKQKERLQRLLERLCDRVTQKGTRIDPALLLAAGLAAVAGLAKKLIPFWSPYQLRHRFATEGERRFGESAVSLAMGHASLHMTEHYIERNLKAVFERMAEQG